MNRTKCVLASILISLPGILRLQAQEVITPLYHNHRAAQQHLNFQSAKKATAATLLELPLFDDFSNSSLIADTGSWSDAFAFVNNNFSVNPVSNGVATLDALDADGSIYANAVLSPSTFEADHLTSHPINLEYPASDSNYLSFLYQPGGHCDLPEEEDSLRGDGRFFCKRFKPVDQCLAHTRYRASPLQACDDSHYCRALFEQRVQIQIQKQGKPSQEQ